MPAPSRPASALLEAAVPVRHGFYGWRGDLSAGELDSLNGIQWCGDAGVSVDADLGGGRIFTNRQIHAGADTGAVFKGEGLVTREPRVGLGVLAADCAVSSAPPMPTGVTGAVTAQMQAGARGLTAPGWHRPIPAGGARNWPE